MSELVLLHHNEPMTTSLAIADGTENTHDAILKMVRKYFSSLQEFGRVGFEIEPFGTSGGVQTREVAFLNEPQATLLITFLRNSEIVVRFKVALVKAFYELRDRLRAVPPAPTFQTSNLSHGADLAVAADRTFRGFLRSARAAGLRLTDALRVANQQTRVRTGMDMLAELGVETTDTPEALAYDPYGASEFMRLWLDGELPLPATHCRSIDLYAAYAYWRKVGAGTTAPINVFGTQVARYGKGVLKRVVWVRYGDARQSSKGVILSWLDNYGTERTVRMAEEFDRFRSALDEWAEG